MSFKIVQEKTPRGSIVLTIVPAAFEENGVFWFPPSSWSTKKRNLVTKNAYAQPNKLAWEARACTLKKKTLQLMLLLRNTRKRF